MSSEEVEALKVWIVERDSIVMASRIQALVVYGMLAAMVGVTIIFTGAPIPTEDVFGPWARLPLGSPALVGGLLILFFAPFSQFNVRAWRVTLAGLILFALWTGVMAATYIFAGHEGSFDFVWPGEHIPNDAARAYIPFLYSFLTIIAVLHIATHVRLRRYIAADRD